MDQSIITHTTTNISDTYLEQHTYPGLTLLAEDPEHDYIQLMGDSADKLNQELILTEMETDTMASSSGYQLHCNIK